MGRNTPLCVNRAPLISLAQARTEMLMADLTLRTLKREREKDWGRFPKPVREEIIKTLHLGRQVEDRLGIRENAEAYEAAIKVLEAAALEEEEQQPNS